jgi:Ca-activated chloride channel family protein
MVAQVTRSAIPQRAGAQQSQETRGSILQDVERVLVEVTITQPDGTLVTDLQKGNFRLYEDGVEQEILSFSSEDAPASIGIIFDTSGSMADKFDPARQAALEFLKASNPRDEFFLVNFSDRAELTSPFTTDIEEMQKRMMSGEPKGSTALLDALYLGLSQMKTATNTRRALLVISDGGDNHSRYSKAQVRSALKEADCSLYAIGFFRLKDILRTFEELHRPGLLSEHAEVTGGRMFPVSSLDQLPETAAKIGLELRSRYVLGYRPSKARHDGGWRKIKVKVAAPANGRALSVYARSGYYSPSY